MSFDVQSVPDLSIMIDRCNCAENYTSGMESLNVHTVLKPTENCIFFNKRVLFSPICPSKKCGINNEKMDSLRAQWDGGSMAIKIVHHWNSYLVFFKKKWDRMV